MSAKKGGLGSGFDSLFSSAEQTEFIESMVSDKKKEKQPDILPLSLIEPNSSQARKNFDREALEELAASIMEHGIISPLIVRSGKNGTYSIIAGERRFRAARMAGLLEVPVIVRDVDDISAAQMSLIENLQREDLNPIEEAMGYKTLADEYKLTQEEISRAVGKSRPTVTNSLRLLSLPEDVIEAIREGKLSTGHAKSLVALGDMASEAAKKVIADDLTVRQTEKLVRMMQNPVKKETTAKNETKIQLENLERELEQTLGRKVKISHNGKRGKITLDYYDNDDFEGLLSYLLNRIV